jgi:hypothetical protein
LSAALRRELAAILETEPKRERRFLEGAAAALGAYRQGKAPPPTRGELRKAAEALRDDAQRLAVRLLPRAGGLEEHLGAAMAQAPDGELLPGWRSSNARLFIRMLALSLAGLTRLCDIILSDEELQTADPKERLAFQVALLWRDELGKPPAGYCNPQDRSQRGKYAKALAALFRAEDGSEPGTLPALVKNAARAARNAPPKPKGPFDFAD